MLVRNLKSLWLVLLSMLSIKADPKATIKTTQLDDQHLSIDITIPLDEGHYLYSDYIQISTNNPSVTLSPWKSSIEPVMHYDSTFKENRKIIKESPTLSFTVTKKGNGSLADVYLRLVYYINKSKTPIENLWPLNFAQTKNQEPIVKQTTANIVTENKPVPQTQEAKTQEPSTSWLGYLKNIATKSNALWIRILIAFLLGLLLSLTPCIYPMIPITIGILQAHGATSIGRNFCLALSYTMGIATTFALLGLAAALAGHAFGSFMNNPLVILIIVALLVYSALSLFGLYEIRIPRFLQKSSVGKGGSFVAAFLFGVASGTVASPCLSPGLLFMLTLVATLKSVFAGFVLLFAFAVGLSIPLLIVGTFSGSLSLLPQAGSWMVEIKYLLGFMLLGMCFYFLSSLLAWPLLLSLMALFFFVTGIFYLYHAKSVTSPAWRLISNILGMALIASSVFFAIKAVQAAYISTKLPSSSQVWMTDYTQALQEAQKTHKNLFIFVHAPRCGACKEIEEKLATDHSLVALKHVVAYQANLANDSDPSMQKLVQQFNILGAPVCLLINPLNQAIIHRWDGELDSTQFGNMIHILEK